MVERSPAIGNINLQNSIPNTNDHQVTQDTERKPINNFFDGVDEIAVATEEMTLDNSTVAATDRNSQLDDMLEEENELIRTENRAIDEIRNRSRQERSQRNKSPSKRRRRRRMVVQAKNQFSQQVLDETPAQVRKFIYVWTIFVFLISCFHISTFQVSTIHLDY